MQDIVFEKPYHFISPGRTRFWPNLMRPLVPWYLDRKYGVTEVQFSGEDALSESIKAGDAVLIASNHSRPCDPVVIGRLYGAIPAPFYFVAAWHVFLNNRIDGWISRRLGAFSLYREGTDRQSLALSLEILERAERPLVLFPEGGITRGNDVVKPLMDGAAWLARTAARRRAKKKAPGKVVVHPIAIKYFFTGDIESTVEPMLADVERQLGVQPALGAPWQTRVENARDTLLAQKERQYYGGSHHSPTHHSPTHQLGFDERSAALIEHLLLPLEQEWLGGERCAGGLARVKALRTAILPEMVQGSVSPEERTRRWRQLSDVYYAHLLYCYPPGYLDEKSQVNTAPERWIETLERIEEDLQDDSRVLRPWKAVMKVGEAIPIAPDRNRNEDDTLNTQIHDRIQAMVDELAASREMAVLTR